MACRLLFALVACVTSERVFSARTFQNEEREEEAGGFARLRVNTVDKVRVEAISREESIRMRQSGLRFHEVEHHHFADKSSKNGKLWQDLKQAAKEQASRDFPWEQPDPSSPPAARARGERTLKRQNAMDRKNTSIATDLQKVLLPQQQIRPTRVAGFLCAQFDLDLFLLSGGVFPGLLGIGLLGDIHYQPATKCFGWTAELYLMLSIGFSVFGMDFRVAVVVIATLVVTERPLAAGSKDLVWELPEGFDTTHCHNKNPFSLIASTSREGWSFIYTHILTHQYLKHAEVEVQKYLEKNKDDINNFKRYLDLIEPPRALPTKVVSASQSQGLAKEGIMGSVQVTGRWGDDGLKLEVTLPKDLRAKGDSVRGNLMQFTKFVRATIWQDLGDALLSQRSDDCRNPPKNGYHCSFVLPARRGARAFVQLTIGATQDFSVPMQLDPSEETFQFPASFRAARNPQDGTLSCQKLTVALPDVTGQCINHVDIKEVQLQVQVSSAQAVATWTPQEFGEKAPWGINVPQSRHEKDNEEIHKALADSSAHGVLVRVYSLGNFQILHLLQQVPAELGPKRSQSFREEKWNMLQRPSTEAADFLATKGLHPLILQSLIHLKLALQQELNDATKDRPISAQVLETLQVSAAVKDIVTAVTVRCSLGELACPEVALRAALNQPERPTALVHGLRACTMNSHKFYYPRDYAPAAERVRFLEKPEGGVNAENITKQLEVMFPKSKHTGESSKWVNYGSRTVRSDSCLSIGFLGAGSAEECQSGCDRVDDKACNTAVFEEEDGWCSLWKCSPWDTFPRQPGKVLSIRTDVPPDLNISHSDLVAFAGLPDWALDRAANIITKGAMARKALLTAMTKVPNLQVSWSKALAEKVWKSPDVWPSNQVVAEGSYRRLLVKVLLEDASWVKSEAAQQTLQNFIGQMASGDGVMVGVSTGNLVGDGAVRQFYSFKNDFGGHAGNRWEQSFELGLRGCKVRVNTSWVWQVPSAAAYFIRPSMVPVAQSLFAAYDQFVSKLPNYGAQVLQRLTVKEDSFWKASVLPYDSTDGRHLHRHMKKGEADRVKVYKGEVATDDAVYNFPKAIKESKYRDSLNFMYNVGLSAANLFLRVVSDVQAMFHLYFADHPDWDGACESLPAQFNLLYEWETARVPSNWVKRGLDTKRKDMSVKPMYRAGRTVSEQGARLTADGEAMIKNWHWVSKPRWFNKEDSRAEFFTQTAPAHGKDGWATPDASQLSAVMWPHVWCELIQQEWSTAAAAKEDKPLTRSGKSVSSSLDDLLSLAKAIPAEVRDIIHKAGFDQDNKTLQVMFRFSLSGPHGGCPVRMVARETTAADTHAQNIVIGWGAMLKISENILEFYRTVLAELTDDLEQVELDGSNQGNDADEDVPTAAPTNETQPDANSIGTSRTAQLETLMDTISIASERWKTEGVNEKGLHRNVQTMWSALFKNMTEADTHAVVDARRSFQEARDKLHALVIAQEARVLQIGQHLDRLLPSASEEAGDDNATDSANASNASKAEVKDYSSLKFAIRFATVLTAATAERQKEAISMFNKIFNCIDVVARPEELPETALNQWAEESAVEMQFRLKDVRNLIHYGAFSADGHDGIELFFEEACTVPTNTNFATPDHERFDHLKEPRPECERVVLSNAMMSIFPNFAARVMYQYSKLQQSLENLVKVPTKELMDYMVSSVEGYVRHLSQGAKSMLMDNDFYKAFSYRKDGSLVGRLWSNLPSALSEIAATLQNRQEGRKQWITESIAYRSKLKTARRGRVRELEKNKTQIPSEEEGCVCEEKWSAYEWTDENTFPRSVTNEGCVKAEGHRWLFSKGNSSGVCKAKQDSAHFEKCKAKYAACDPEASPVRPQFQIWRSADVLHADPVRLPLLQLDLYMHVDIRNRRADFCTPNFAPIMLDTNWHWSTSSWLPYDLRRSVCFGARIHPPGVSLAVTRCEHKGMGIKRSSKSTEWSLTGVAYLISHYNVWGTGDGDMTHSWFGGGDNWGSKAMSTGWPNFLAADPGTWASSSAGGGYLQTGNLMSSPSTFWFSLVAEVLSALSLSEAVNDENTTTTKATVKGVMVSAATIIWKLLQRYAVIPSLWDLMVSAGTVLKTFGDIGLKNLAITPFRNEHDVVLSFKMATQWTRRELDLKSLIGDLSLDQMRVIFQTLEDAGVPVKKAWGDYQNTSLGSAQDVHNLNRETLITLTKTYMRTGAPDGKPVSFLTADQVSHRLLRNLFARCSGRPIWYKVQSHARVPIYTFWRPDSSAWISPALPAGTELMLSQWDDDWLRVIAAEEEEDRYIPSRYIRTAALQNVGDVIQTALQTSMANSKKLRPDQVENILRKASSDTLRCWAAYIKSAKPALMHEVIREAWRTENERAAYADTSRQNNVLGPSRALSEVDGFEVPIGFFSKKCVRKFLVKHYDDWSEWLSKNSSDKNAFHAIFRRGKSSRIKLEAKNNREIAVAKTSYTDVGLSILTRLGFPFISLPGIFQLQPYMQLSVQYDVAQVIRVLKARIRGSTADASSMTSYLRRKEACEQCVSWGQAFCDRQEAADAMLQGGHVVEMDACEPRTKINKARCKDFFWNTPDSGSLFVQAVCPCYKAVSGNQIYPRWITSSASCADISWPDSEVEELKRASKDRDWRSGFAYADAGGRRLQMSQVALTEPAKMMDCFGGYRCCGWKTGGGKIKEGEKWTKLRCVHSRSLYLKSSWLHPVSACKYYEPTDVTGEWHHAAESCGDDKDEGHFKWNTETRIWEMEESSKLEHESVEGEVLTQDDNE